MKSNEILLVVDGNEPVTLESFIMDNTAQDVEPISETDIEKVSGLQVNQSVYVGMVEVKRVKP